MIQVASHPIVQVTAALVLSSHTSYKVLRVLVSSVPGYFPVSTRTPSASPRSCHRAGARHRYQWVWLPVYQVNISVSTRLLRTFRSLDLLSILAHPVVGVNLWCVACYRGPAVQGREHRRHDLEHNHNTGDGRASNRSLRSVIDYTPEDHPVSTRVPHQHD